MGQGIGRESRLAVIDFTTWPGRLKAEPAITPDGDRLIGAIPISEIEAYRHLNVIVIAEPQDSPTFPISLQIKGAAGSYSRPPWPSRR